MRFVIESHEPLTQNVYHIRLSGDTRAIVRPGQFVQVQLPGFYLRRPISVCDWRPGEEGTLDLIYKVVGLGTEAMSHYAAGTELDLLTGLGNGFDVDRLDEVTASQFPLLVGGGVGTPPLYGLCKKLLAECKEPRVILGFNTAAEVFWQREFEALGVPLTVTTADGTQGVKGFVTDAMVPWKENTTMYTPADRSPCCVPCMPCAKNRISMGSSALRSACPAASGCAWAVHAKPGTAASASARMARCSKGRRSYGRYARDPLRLDA